MLSRSSSAAAMRITSSSRPTLQSLCSSRVHVLSSRTESRVAARSLSTSSSRQDAFPEPPSGQHPNTFLFAKNGLRRQFRPIVSTRTSDGGNWNKDLDGWAEAGNLVATLDTASKMQAAGVTPNQGTYNAIIKACAKHCRYEEAMVFYEDMQRLGIAPNTQTFTSLLEAAHNCDNQQVDYILDLMRQTQTPMDASTFQQLIHRHVLRQELEMCIQRLEDMVHWGVGPLLVTIEAVVRLAGELQNPRLAHTLAATYEAQSTRGLDAHSWMNILIGSAEMLYPEGTEAAWDKVRGHNIVPDEGLCVAVLHCAARHGRPELASLAIEQLQLMGARQQEHHFAPLVDSFVVADQLKSALQTLTFMRSLGVIPTLKTASKILEHISAGSGFDKTDEAFNMLYDLQDEGTVVDIVAMNVVVAAAARKGDLARAVGIYTAAGDWKLKPDIDTFKIVLHACLQHGTPEHVSRIIEHMGAQGIKSDAEVHEILILLELKAKDGHYEDAFWRLEVMKKAGFTPSAKVYESIAETCLSNNDTRHKLVVDEMKQQGHSVSARLAEWLEKRTAPPKMAKYQGDRPDYLDG